MIRVRSGGSESMPNSAVVLPSVNQTPQCHDLTLNGEAPCLPVSLRCNAPPNAPYERRCSSPTDFLEGRPPASRRQPVPGAPCRVTES
jgi:hypothetical protein